ncbi:hypothetical protein [Roseibacillus persicicus]|uniref:hypothetical protein n=1 Tax=Roseibacillus persicicus TaxID=454148 RepID=UPI00280DA6FC|nr:hypothetical protein [Roseibacillus persicicus]MDQ8192651.1 hypothetical protein [Roseibacillus persicicus]
MKSKRLSELITAVAVLSTSLAATELEVRLLHAGGSEPNETTLAAIVENSGAQVAPVFQVKLVDAGETEIKAVAPFRYPTEYSPQGQPNGFETRNIGWEGKVDHEAVADSVKLKLKLMNTSSGPPEIYQMDGFQVVMPVFKIARAPEKELLVTVGEWHFVKGCLNEMTVFWAVRVAESE